MAKSSLVTPPIPALRGFFIQQSWPHYFHLRLEFGPFALLGLESHDDSFLKNLPYYGAFANPFSQ